MVWTQLDTKNTHTSPKRRRVNSPDSRTRERVVLESKCAQFKRAVV